MSYTDYNIVTVGSPTSTNGVISGFSNSNYVYSVPSFLPGTSTWEIGIKFKPYSVHTGGLFNKIHNDYYGLRISAASEGQIYYLISSTSGQQYLFEGNGSHSYVLNQWNWVKFEWTGSVYNAYFSTDGENWELDKTYTSSTRYYDDYMPTTIGCEPGIFRPFDGEIDLTECYFKINGEERWRGATNYYDLTINPTPADSNVNIDTEPKIQNFTITGNVTNNNGVLSNFSTSNYGTIPNPFQPNNNPWEVMFDITTGSDVSSYQSIYATANQTSGYTVAHEICIEGGTMHALGNLQSNGVWNINFYILSSVAANTRYLIKYQFDGVNQYTSSYSTNGGTTWISGGSQTTSETIYSNRTFSSLGIRYFNGIDAPFKGSINTKNSYIKINNEYFWQGYKNQPYYTPLVYNIATIGSLTNNNGVLSNFSRSSYAVATTSFSPGDSSWEIGIKFVYTGNGSDYGTALEKTRNTWYGLRLQMGDGGKFGMYGDIELTGITVLSVNTTYWARFKYDGTSLYTYELSTDGINYIVENTLTSSSKISSFTADTNIGYHVSTGSQDRVWQGTIDLNECYFKVNGAEQWRGMTPGQELGYLENTTITYSVSKEGYQTQSDTFNITQDTVLNIVLQELTRNHIAIGNGELIKGYVGSNEVSKIYLGNVLLYEKV